MRWSLFVAKVTLAESRRRLSERHRALAELHGQWRPKCQRGSKRSATPPAASAKSAALSSKLEPRSVSGTDLVSRRKHSSRRKEPIAMMSGAGCRVRVKQPSVAHRHTANSLPTLARTFTVGSSLTGLATTRTPQSVWNERGDPTRSIVDPTTPCHLPRCANGASTSDTFTEMEDTCDKRQGHTPHGGSRRFAVSRPVALCVAFGNAQAGQIPFRCNVVACRVL